MWFVFRALVVAWATLAIYFSNLPWPGCGWGWPWSSPRSRSGRCGCRRDGAIAGLRRCLRRCRRVVVAIPPSHDREWRPEVAVMPRAIIDGDRVRLTGFRNFEYRSRDDFTLRYEEREVSLSHLTGVDFYISYWSEGLVGHTFVSFVFDNAPPLSISIETRPEVGEGFAPVASLFKQFELIYVVGDERDIVRVRTNYRDEAVYRYRIATPRAEKRAPAVPRLSRSDQRTGRPCGVLPSAQQQLHDQHHKVLNAAGRKDVSTSAISSMASSTATSTTRVVSTRRCRSTICAGARSSMRPRKRPTEHPISRIAFAQACRRSRTDCASH